MFIVEATQNDCLLPCRWLRVELYTEIALHSVKISENGFHGICFYLHTTGTEYFCYCTVEYKNLTSDENQKWGTFCYFQFKTNDMHVRSTYILYSVTFKLQKLFMTLSGHVIAMETLIAKRTGTYF